MSKSFEAVVLIALMALPLLAFSPPPIHAARPMVPAPPTPQIAALMKTSACSLPAPQCLASINWSGYAVTGATDSVTLVDGSWTAPAIARAVGNTCPDMVNTWLDASFWVGIDGFSSPTVEQIGTAADCLYGQAQYYAWYEFYPAAGFTISKPIYPGDAMSAEVKWVSGTTFTASIQDTTAGHSWSFSHTGSAPGALRNSAQWITEAAAGCITSDCSYFNFLALTDFTSVTFTGATATVGGHTYPVSSAAWGTSLYWIEVTTVFYPPPGPFLRAIPTTAKSGGFTIKWVSSGP